MTIEFDMTLLDLDGIGDSPNQVTRAEVDALVAYSIAVSLKRIAVALERGVVEGGRIDAVAEPMMVLKRGTAPAAVPPVAPPASAAPKPMPVDFRAWGGGSMPADQRSDVIVWYRRGKSSKMLAAGSVNWAHNGGPDDVLGWRMINDALDPESRSGTNGDGGN